MPKQTKADLVKEVKTLRYKISRPLESPVAPSKVRLEEKK